MKDNKLAIIIPAYKIVFFERMLSTFSRQTCKKFTLYIGIDNSPDNFEDLIRKYEKSIDIVYKRFDINLGGVDLVSQWERCIALSQKEEWIWLFSDDDEVEENCVEMFYKMIEQYPNHDIYHFDIKIIDSNSNIIRLPICYPKTLSSKNYYRKRFSGKLVSFIVENIFSRVIYEEIGGIKNFPMAWEADTATWMLMSYKKGFRTIDNAYVRWRNSGINITSDFSKSEVKKKLDIEIYFFKWAEELYSETYIHYFNYYAFTRILGYYSQVVSFRDISSIVKKYIKINKGSIFFYYTLMILFPIKRYLKNRK